jgi:hypothetical protein
MARIAGDARRFRVTCAGYTIECVPDGLPLTYDSLKEHAALVEEIELHEHSTEQDVCCLTVKRAGEKWPSLVVAQTYWPHGAGFEPGALLIPETRMLFFGAGERLLAYRLEQPLTRTWEDRVEMGFWGWEQHGDTVLLAGELEFAAWNNLGRKLWTTFVEPPWDFTVKDDVVELDVMGAKRSFKLSDGPSGR